MNQNIRTFLQIASDDLQASKILYKKKKYPHSVFFFEQSVEKTCKYLLLSNNVLDVDQLNKKIRHNSIIVFKLYSDYIIKGVTALFDISHDQKNNFNIITPKEVVEDLKTGISTFENMSNERFSELNQSVMDMQLALLKQFSDNTYINSKYNKFFNSDPETLFNFFSNYIKLDKNEKMMLENNIKDPAFKTQLFKNIENALASTRRSARIEQTLMVLSQIFSSHSERTRYPDNNLNSCPNTLYNKTSILVQNLKKLYPYQDKILSNLTNN